MPSGRRGAASPASSRGALPRSIRAARAHTCAQRMQDDGDDAAPKKVPPPRPVARQSVRRCPHRRRRLTYASLVQEGDSSSGSMRKVPPPRPVPRAAVRFFIVGVAGEACSLALVNNAGRRRRVRGGEKGTAATEACAAAGALFWPTHPPAICKRSQGARCRTPTKTRRLKRRRRGRPQGQPCVGHPACTRTRTDRAAAKDEGEEPAAPRRVPLPRASTKVVRRPCSIGQHMQTDAPSAQRRCRPPRLTPPKCSSPPTKAAATRTPDLKRRRLGPSHAPR